MTTISSKAEFTEFREKVHEFCIEKILSLIITADPLPVHSGAMWEAWETIYEDVDDATLTLVHDEESDSIQRLKDLYSMLLKARLYELNLYGDAKTKKMEIYEFSDKYFEKLLCDIQPPGVLRVVPMFSRSESQTPTGICEQTREEFRQALREMLSASKFFKNVLHFLNRVLIMFHMFNMENEMDKKLCNLDTVECEEEEHNVWELRNRLRKSGKICSHNKTDTLFRNSNCNRVAPALAEQPPDPGSGLSAQGCPLFLGKGTFNSVYNFDDGNVVVRVSSDTYDGKSKKEFDDEADLMLYMSQIGAGPKVYGLFVPDGGMTLHDIMKSLNLKIEKECDLNISVQGRAVVVLQSGYVMQKVLSTERMHEEKVRVLNTYVCARILETAMSGVICVDIKPGNIIIVPNDESSTDSVDELTVPQLRKRLMNLKQSAFGSKAILRDRLRKFENKNMSSTKNFVKLIDFGTDFAQRFDNRQTDLKQGAAILMLLLYDMHLHYRSEMRFDITTFDDSIMTPEVKQFAKSICATYENYESICDGLIKSVDIEPWMNMVSNVDKHYFGRSVLHYKRFQSFYDQFREVLEQ